MKNNHVFLLSMMFLLSASFTNDDDIVYRKSIISHLSNIQLDTIYIIKSSDIDINLPPKLSRYHIVDIENVNEFMKDKESLYVIKLMPIQLNKDKINITLVDFLLERNQESEINLTNTGSEVFTFDYNPKINSYELVTKKKIQI